ncbi:Regulator of microtubule dynamics protein 1 [Aphelenchoides besseyi]|nr:Regulator of microtubule dynamics protein 1 [Aphelenchoides besseyi]KAI6210543.1 Regulator of microtubule dynamics protein 1 [Aphelenchoides besseyi]
MAKVYGTKSTEEALKHLLHVITCNPNDVFGYIAIGLQFHAIQDYRHALTYFLKAEQIKSNISSSNLFYIGDCYRKVGQIAESVDYFKRALTVPVRNRVDFKGWMKSRKYLSGHGFTEAQLDSMSPEKPSYK